MLAIVPVTSSVPPVAAMVAAPVADIGAAILPRPVIVPVLRLRPAATVRAEDAPSSLTLLAPTASAPDRVNAPAVLSSSVPVEPPKVSAVAAPTASISSLSVAPAPIVKASALPVLAIVPVTSSAPPVAAMVAAPVAAIAAASLP